MSADSGPRHPSPAPPERRRAKARLPGGGASNGKPLSRVGQREIDVHGVNREMRRPHRLDQGAVTSPCTALTSRPTRRATSRIDKAPWPVIALRISHRFLVRVFQSRSTEFERDVRAWLLAAERGGGAARNALTRGDRKGHGAHAGLH